MSTNLYMRHDSELKAHPDILAARTRGASLVRLTLARMYGHPHMATADGWHIVPHVTERDTIGVVDVAAGTAWDSMVAVTDDVRSLGLDEVHTPEGNHPSLAGDVRFDGELVQRRGETPGKPITAPPGWQRIGLPTWRGYGDGSDPQTDPGCYREVPARLYRREQQIHPQLRAVGLMTCYGRHGMPRGMLDDAAGHESKTRPAWVHAQFERANIDSIRRAIPEDIARDLVLAAREHAQAMILHVARREPWLEEMRQAIAAGRRSDAWHLTYGPRREDRSWTALDRGPVVSDAISHDTRLAGHVLSELGDSADQTSGLDWYGILRDVIRRVALDRTAGARAQIERTLTEVGDERNTYLSYRAIMLPLARQVAEWVTAGAQLDFGARFQEILYRHGPIYVDMPAASED